MSFLEKYLLMSSVFCWDYLFCCYWVVCAICLFWKLSPVSHIVCKCFLPFCRLSFFFLWFPLLCESLQVWLGPICLFLLLFLLPWETDIGKHWYSLCPFCLPSLEGVFGYLIFRSIIHFEFIFVYGVMVCSNFLDLHLVASTFPVLVAEETVFSPLCILSSFVEE